MARISTIELFKEEMKFSIGHFTIFSEKVRENLHGHNYNVYAAITTTLIEDEGLSFDYRFYRDKFLQLCQDLDETFILPAHSKYLKIAEVDSYYHCQFADEVIIFLKRDAKILPLTNVTVEELSNWLIEQVVSDTEELEKNNVHEITIKVFSGPGQSGSSTWRKA